MSNKNVNYRYLLVDENFNVNFVAETRDQARYAKRVDEKIIQIKNTGKQFETKFIR